MEARWDYCSLKIASANVGAHLVSLEHWQGEQCTQVQSIPRRTLCECSLLQPGWLQSLTSAGALDNER